MRFLIALGLIAGLAGCTQNSLPDASDLKQRNLRYFKDTRTSICYAAMNSQTKDGWHTTTITYVPCTEAVEKQIEADK